ncbi:MAG: DegT/DnrJ/EryC1/StrS family aminotransferase [Polyangiaceae bacterium]
MKHNIPVSKPFIGEEEKRAVLEVMDSGMIVQGPRTAKLEEEFAKVVGTKFAVATSSGTTALHIALLANDIGPGDEVITSPFTFIASVNSIVYAGAKPVFADIEERTFNISPEAIEKAITPKTKAIMPVHIYGQSCDMDAIMAIAKKHNLIVLEDCAQSIGASYKKKMTGSFGTGSFSLYATKNVMSGEGGMITTDSEKVAELAKTLRQHGMRRRYYHDILGFNFRMTDLHAAIGLVQLGRLADFTEKRRKNAAYLNAHLRRVKTPFTDTDKGADHVWHQYTVRLEGATADERDRAVAKLNEAGVGCGVFYPVPANKQKHLQDMGLGAANVPVAEKLSNEVFSLPVHPQLSPSDLEIIVREVNAL